MMDADWTSGSLAGVAKDHLVVRLVVIPDDDEFGVKSFIQDSTIVGPEMSRIFASALSGRLLLAREKTSVERTKQPSPDQLKKYQGDMREQLEYPPPKLE